MARNPFTEIDLLDENKAAFLAVALIAGALAAGPFVAFHMVLPPRVEAAAEVTPAPPSAPPPAAKKKAAVAAPAAKERQRPPPPTEKLTPRKQSPAERCAESSSCRSCVKRCESRDCRPTESDVARMAALGMEDDEARRAASSACGLQIGDCKLQCMGIQ